MNKDHIVMKAVEYIEDNLEQDLTLDTVCEQTGYSKFYLNRLFSEQIGCTVYKYIQTRRLTEAARKLVETNKPIVDIAFEAAYQSQQAFTNAFGRVYRNSPQIYRGKKSFFPKMPKYQMIFVVPAKTTMSGCVAA